MIRKNKTDPPTGTVRRFVYVAWMLLLLLGSSNDAAAQTAAKTTPNRLIHESSPYLLQHATNPVDWYPWGRGGWPNSVFLTPDKKPFFAGTYFPKQTRWGLPAAKDTRAMFAALRKPFLPSKVVLLRPADKKAADEIIRMSPYTEFMVPKDGRATAYVCSNFVCKLPTTDVSQMLANLQVKSD